MLGTQTGGGPEQGFWRWLADGLQRFSFVCGKNYPCEVYVKLCHMFSVMKILLKQNIEAKGPQRKRNQFSNSLDMKLRVQHLLDTVKFLFLEPHFFPFNLAKTEFLPQNIV